MLHRQPNDQIPQLTGLRAVGSIMVVLYHFHVSAVHPIFQPLLSYGGGMGVALFFGLSGYILTLIYAGTFQNRISRKDYGRFIWRRIARIYPLHLIFLLFVVMTYPTFVDPALSGPRQLVLNLLMMQAWTFDPFICSSILVDQHRVFLLSAVPVYRQAPYRAPGRLVLFHPRDDLRRCCLGSLSPVGRGAGFHTGYSDTARFLCSDATSPSWGNYRP